MESCPGSDARLGRSGRSAWPSLIDVPPSPKCYHEALFRRAYLRPVMLAFLVAAFNQLSGINFIIYFAPRVFELAGLDSSSALPSTAGIGVVNLLLTMLGMYLIVIRVFIAEIFPHNVRTKGQSLGGGTHWVFAALITLFMPYFLGRFDGATIFGFFTAMMVLQLVFVLFLMPDTKGRSLESLAEHLSVHEHPSFDELVP